MISLLLSALLASSIQCDENGNCLECDEQTNTCQPVHIQDVGQFVATFEPDPNDPPTTTGGTGTRNS
jgi:hypothetical protein